MYLIARVANEIPEFRWRIRDGKVFEHESVQPSFTVFTEVADVFSFCTVDYEEDAKSFIARAFEKSEKMRTAPSFEDEAGRDDFLFLSAIPSLGLVSSISKPKLGITPLASSGRSWKKKKKTTT